jgi:DNA repair photolyase
VSAKKDSIGRLGGNGKLSEERPIFSSPELGRTPVHFREANTLLSFNNEEFHERQLCDGIILDLGDACALASEFPNAEYFKHVVTLPERNTYDPIAASSYVIRDAVIRRQNAIERLKRELFDSNGGRKFKNPKDIRVLLGSSLVDVASNMEVLGQTAEACNLLLDHTHFQIRLLSSGNLLHKLIDDKMIPDKHRCRIIFCYAFSTLDDQIAQAIEANAPPALERINSMAWLRGRGFRTCAMISPSLPQRDYVAFSGEISTAIGPSSNFEHIWAEVISNRGNSVTRTLEALRRAKLHEQVAMLEEVSGPRNSKKWEDFARATFEAHAANFPSKKLRFLHYVEKGTTDWWETQMKAGAVLIGPVAKERSLITIPTVSGPPLSDGERKFRYELETCVTDGIEASIRAAKALFDIYSYKGGILWRSEYFKFEDYCQKKWDYGRAHSYRLVDCGEFINDLGYLVANQSPIGDWETLKPENESHVRALGPVPKENRAACWLEYAIDTLPSERTAKKVADMAKQYVADNGVEKKAPATKTVEARKSQSLAALQRLEVSVQDLSSVIEIKHFLLVLKLLIEKSK